MKNPGSYFGSYTPEPSASRPEGEKKLYLLPVLRSSAFGVQIDLAPSTVKLLIEPHGALLEGVNDCSFKNRV